MVSMRRVRSMHTRTHTPPRQQYKESIPLHIPIQTLSNLCSCICVSLATTTVIIKNIELHCCIESLYMYRICHCYMRNRFCPQLHPHVCRLSPQRGVCPFSRINCNGLAVKAKKTDRERMDGCSIISLCYLIVAPLDVNIFTI